MTTSWQPSTTSITTFNWITSTPDFSQVFASTNLNTLTNQSEIYKSTDGGDSYALYYTVSDPLFQIYQMCCTSTTLFFFTSNSTLPYVYYLDITGLTPTVLYINKTKFVNDTVVSIAISNTPSLFITTPTNTYYSSDNNIWTVITTVSGGFSIAVSDNCGATTGNIYIVGYGDDTIYVFKNGYNSTVNTVPITGGLYIYCSKNQSITSNISLVTIPDGIAFSTDSGDNYSTNKTNSLLLTGAVLSSNGDTAVLITQSVGIYMNSGNFSNTFVQMPNAPSTSSTNWIGITGNNDLSNMSALIDAQTPYFYIAPTCYWEDSWIDTLEGAVQIKYIKPGDKIKIYGDILNNNIGRLCEPFEAEVKWCGSFIYRGVLICIKENSLPIPLCVSPSLKVRGETSGVPIPSTDVWVTLGHRFFYNNRFITADQLLKEIDDENKVYYHSFPNDGITCFHLETEKHSIINTSGLLTETLLDCGSQSGDYKTTKFQFSN
jgi:hypothetical protein